MQKKNWVLFGLITGLLAACLVVLQSSSAPVRENPTCCKKMMKQCPGRIKKAGQDGMIMETLSRQFIYFTPAAY